MSTAIARPIALIFDWDNTLVDSWPAIYNAFNATLIAMGHEPWTVAEARERIGPPAEKAFPPLFGDRWQEAAKFYYRFFEDSPDRFAKPLPGAEKLLKASAELGVFMSVISNKRGPHLRAEAQKLGWDGYFKTIIGAGDAAAAKPDPAPMVLALENSHIAPSQDVWYIGDHHTDLLFAANTGCRGILINGQDLKGLSAEHSFKDCNHFTNFIRENYL